MIGLEEQELPDDDILHSLILIKDMVVNDVSPIAAEDNLHEALQKLLDSDYDKLPVMRMTEGEHDGGRARRILGLYHVPGSDAGLQRGDYQVRAARIRPAARNRHWPCYESPKGLP